MKEEWKRLGKGEYMRKYLNSSDVQKIVDSANDSYIKKEHIDFKILKQDITRLKEKRVFEFELDKDLSMIELFNSKEKIYDIINEMVKPITGIHLSSKTIKSKRRNFLGKDIKEWLIKFLKTDDSEIISPFLSFLIKQKIIIGKKDTFEETGIFYYAFKKRLVIIGAGISGISIAKKLKDDFDVYVIDARDGFQYLPGFYKIISNPNYIQNVELPYTKILDGCTYINERVKSISPTGVYLENELVFFDYLVVATGSRYVVPFEVTQEVQSSVFRRDELYEDEKKPVKLAKIFQPYDLRHLVSAFEHLHKAKNVIVIGGGPVAIETLGEIGTKYPKAKVTLITQFDRILERLDEGCQKSIEKIISSYTNCSLLFNRRVTKIENDKVFFTKNILAEGESKQESFMAADVIFICVGFRPNSYIFRNYMSDSLNISGYVSVNPYFQVNHSQNKYTHHKLIELTKTEIERNQKELFKVQTEYSLKKKDSIRIQKDVKEVPESKEDEEKIEKEMMEIVQKTSSNNDLLQEIDLNSKNFYQNIFAIGDVIDSENEKLAIYAKQHADCVSENILNLETFTKKQPPPKHFNQKDKNTMMNIKCGNSGIFITSKKLKWTGAINVKTKEYFETSYIKGLLQ